MNRGDKPRRAAAAAAQWKIKHDVERMNKWQSDSDEDDSWMGAFAPSFSNKERAADKVKEEPAKDVKDGRDEEKEDYKHVDKDHYDGGDELSNEDFDDSDESTSSSPFVCLTEAEMQHLEHLARRKARMVHSDRSKMKLSRRIDYNRHINRHPSSPKKTEVYATVLMFSPPSATRIRYIRVHKRRDRCY